MYGMRFILRRSNQTFPEGRARTVGRATVTPVQKPSRDSAIEKSQRAFRMAALFVFTLDGCTSRLPQIDFLRAAATPESITVRTAR